jgi:ornithine carbamoyltransferase
MGGVYCPHGGIYGDRSVVFDQAENRLHTQKALLVFLFGLA